MKPLHFVLLLNLWIAPAGPDHANTSRDQRPGEFGFHTRNGRDQAVTSPLGYRDCLIWLQTPVGYYGAYRYVSKAQLTDGRLPGNTVWIKQAMFANTGGNEMLVETTVEFRFCYEEKQ